MTLSPWGALVPCIHYARGYRQTVHVTGYANTTQHVRRFHDVPQFSKAKNDSRGFRFSAGKLSAHSMLPTDQCQVPSTDRCDGGPHFRSNKVSQQSHPDNGMDAIDAFIDSLYKAAECCHGSTTRRLPGRWWSETARVCKPSRKMSQQAYA